jgi:hypothetical protein
MHIPFFFIVISGIEIKFWFQELSFMQIKLEMLQ